MLVIQNSCLANSYFSKKTGDKESAMGTVASIIVNSL